MGDNHVSAIGTSVERQTRMVRLMHLARSEFDSLHSALIARMGDLPSALLRSITSGLIRVSGRIAARNINADDMFISRGYHRAVVLIQRRGVRTAVQTRL